MSDLRTRIAAAIAKAQFDFDEGEPYNGPEDAEVLADAVITELGLEEELTYGGTMRRYVTDWKADNETD